MRFSLADLSLSMVPFDSESLRKQIGFCYRRPLQRQKSGQLCARLSCCYSVLKEASPAPADVAENPSCSSSMTRTAFVNRSPTRFRPSFKSSRPTALRASSACRSGTFQSCCSTSACRRWMASAHSRRSAKSNAMCRQTRRKTAQMTDVDLVKLTQHVKDVIFFRNVAIEISGVTLAVVRGFQFELTHVFQIFSKTDSKPARPVWPWTSPSRASSGNCPLATTAWAWMPTRRDPRSRADSAPSRTAPVSASAATSWRSWCDAKAGK